MATVTCLALWSTPSWSLQVSSSSQQQPSSRRAFFQAATSAVTTSGMVAASTVVWTLSPFGSVVAAVAADDLVSFKDELSVSKSKLKEIPDLLQAQEWDKVRNILKTPPVNKLWNLGDSQNTVLKLAKETGDVELFELKDELAYNLQMCDQLTYNNVFVYFQPGSGKIKIKEPTDSAKKAMEYLDQILAATN